MEMGPLDKLTADDPRVIDSLDPNLVKLLTHGRNNLSSFVPKYGSFAVSRNGVISGTRGLTKFLKKTLFEGYKRPSSIKAARVSMWRGVGRGRYVEGTSLSRRGSKPTQAKTRKPRVKKKVSFGDPWGDISLLANDKDPIGFARGNLVHNELCIYFRCFNGRNGIERFHAMVPQPHEYTTQAIEEITRRGWTPVWSEFIVMDEALNVTTSVDGIILDEHGKLGLLEFKTGYNGIFEYGETKMTKPLSNVMNTPLNQARVQLMLPIVTLRVRYGVVVNSAWVMHISDEGPFLHGMLQDILVLSNVMYTHLVTNHGSGCAKRKKNKKAAEKKRKRQSSGTKPKPKRKPRKKKPLYVSDLQVAVTSGRGQKRQRRTHAQVTASKYTARTHQRKYRKRTPKKWTKPRH